MFYLLNLMLKGTIVLKQYHIVYFSIFYKISSMYKIIIKTHCQNYNNARM